jgi:hypothetical protein
MDYVGRKGNAFHINWTGHKFMYSLLFQLGADLREWSGTNDGEYISAATCNEWANLLKKNIHRIKLMLVPNDAYDGGYQELPLLEDKQLHEELTNGVAAQSLMFENLLRKMFDQDIIKIDPRRIKTVKLDRKTKNWILGFAKFLKECGGCWQY